MWNAPPAGWAKTPIGLSGRTSKTVKRLTSRRPILIRRVTKKVYVIFGKGGFLTFTSLLPIATDSIKPHFEWKNHGTQVTLTLVLYSSDKKLNVEKFAAETYQLKRWPIWERKRKRGLIWPSRISLIEASSGISSEICPQADAP